MACAFEWQKRMKEARTLGVRDYPLGCNIGPGRLSRNTLLHFPLIIIVLLKRNIFFSLQYYFHPSPRECRIKFKVFGISLPWAMKNNITS